MENSYVDKVREWVDLDNQSIDLKTSLNKVNDEKKQLEDDILEYVEKNNLENVSLTLSDGKLKFPKTVVKQSLSMKYLKTAFTKYNEENPYSTIDTETVCKFLVDNLDSSSKISIKRYVRS
jgi:hypothetical protein